MKTNIGTMDRAIRVIVGVVLIGLGIRNQSWWGLIGLLPLLTAVVRFCPVYVPFGLSTCPAEKEKAAIPPDGPKLA